MPSLESKFAGGMVGSAVGDAIGELAFQFPEKAALLTRIESVKALTYTDDTAMAIGLAESLIAKGSVDQEHLGETLRRNFSMEPWRGYAAGPPTIFSLVEDRRLTYREAAKSLFRGRGSFGNGAAMRIGPLGLFLYDRPDLYDEARASAEVTHAHAVGVDGAAVQAAAVAEAVRQDPEQDLRPDSFIAKLESVSRTREIRQKLALVKRLLQEGADDSSAAETLGRSVAVHESMPFALYAFVRHARSFEDCLFCAILNGGDRDTLGAMACAISGAYLGVDAIPFSWVEKLENRDTIEDLTSDLADMARGNT